MRSICDPGSVPAGFAAAADALSRTGAYVLALAQRRALQGLLQPAGAGGGGGGGEVDVSAVHALGSEVRMMVV